MSDESCGQDIKAMFNSAAGNFPEVIGRPVELFACGCIAFDPTFDAAKNMLEENRVRTGPATPEAAQNGGDKKQREAQSADREKENPQVLGQQRQPKNMESSVFDIEKHGGRPIDRNPRQSRIKNDEKKSKVTARGGESTAHIRWMKHVVGSIRVDRGH